MDKRQLIMYMHAGSANHGCEAIVNSLCHMIKEKPVLVSYFGKEDEAYTLKDLCTIISERRFEDNRLMHVFYYIYRKLTKDETSFVRYRYRGIFNKEMSPLAISIGGDNYCYETMLHDLFLANRAFEEKGVKTMLLGCSIEPELLKRQEIITDLMKYHTIIARESITFKALKEMADAEARTPEQSGIPTILCYPDPAFILGKKELPPPEGFIKGNTVGINISPMIQDNEKADGITMENYRELIRDIITGTDMQIALIPHVVRMQNDDRKPIHQLYEEFKDTGRVIEIPDGSCQELKGYISSCRFFVGARTHATIAAYSTCVPTLVVGYSVKARGIARDLFGTEEHYVLPVQSLKKKDDLKNGFSWLVEREEEIRRRLEQIMPEYQEKALLTGKEVDRLWDECSRLQKI